MSEPPEETSEPQEVAAAPSAPLDPWRVPLHCFHCGGAWDVARRAFRTGGVLRCPQCRAAYVVQTSMYLALADKLESLTARGIGPADDIARGELDALSREFRPPGVPRKPAGIFG